MKFGYEGPDPPPKVVLGIVAMIFVGAIILQVIALALS